MGQFIALIIILIIAKLIVDLVKEQLNRNQGGQKNGEVIDISDSWVDTSSLPYQKKAQIMSPREIAFYHSLAEVLNDSDYVIAPHLHMSELITVTDNPRQQEYLQRLKERNLDLTILEAVTFRPVLVINFAEEDIGRKQQLSNNFTSKAVKAANLPQLDINPGNPPIGQELLIALRRQGLTI
ncbi:MAG: DUF2726 domain-containing protein [Syntrophomonadaceae bacterium]|nr:DUF2726 domain-containing protein [Syntrophomonadaceae bacterium]